MEEVNNSSGRLDPVGLLEQLKTASVALEKQISQLNTESVSMQELTMEISDIFDRKVEDLKQSVSGIELSISGEELKKLDSYKDYFKHYKPIMYLSLFVMISGWGLSMFGSYSGLKYYKESVRTKAEIRGEVLQEIERSGNIIVEKQKWDSYQEQIEVLNAWQKSNPKDSESLVNYFKGYKASKKEAK